VTELTSSGGLAANFTPSGANFNFWSTVSPGSSGCRSGSSSLLERVSGVIGGYSLRMKLARLIDLPPGTMEELLRFPRGRVTLRFALLGARESDDSLEAPPVRSASLVGRRGFELPVRF
jgi:hypothetical protein